MKTKLLIAIAAMVACSGAWAQIQLNEISNNTVADADKVMENFNALKDGVNEIPSPPDEACNKNQATSWNGTEWKCWDQWLYGWYYTEFLDPIDRPYLYQVFEKRSRNASIYDGSGVLLEPNLSASGQSVSGSMRVHLAGVGNYSGCLVEAEGQQPALLGWSGGSRFLQINVDLTYGLPLKLIIACPPVDEP